MRKYFLTGLLILVPIAITAWVLFAIILLITTGQFWLAKKWVHYEGGQG